MSFPISAALLDAIVLSVVAQEPEGTYGYKITQQPDFWTFFNLRFMIF